MNRWVMEGERNDGGVCVLRGVAVGKNRGHICMYILWICVVTGAGR